MNRAFPALGLLLGTLAAALIAVGVARDLERAGMRPSSAKVDRTQNTPAVLRPASVERAWSADWRRWTKPLVAVSQQAIAAQSPPSATRPIVDRRAFAATLARCRAGDTARVDALIRTSDGIDDLRESDTVPLGHVLVGGRLVKLEHRGRRLEVGEAWTSRLHYEPDRRQTLAPLDPATALSRYRAAPLPGDKLLLWSDDRRTLIDWTHDAAAEAFDLLRVALRRADGFVTLAAWSQRQVSDGWTMLANHVKRQAWVATLPPLPDAAPVQSAQRLPEGKR